MGSRAPRRVDGVTPALLTNDLDSLQVQLERAGFEVVFDREIPGYRRFYTRDPFGNRVELMQPN